ncbi:MAG TPA: porin [Steroidobacteraceae bacterium]|jgi:phosphate-selective porin OprO/OprP|nr:porin [Steroidobacteraceae bacterium]
MGNNRFLRVAVLAALAVPFGAHAEEVSNEELLKRIEEQDQKILVLERKLEIQDEAATSAKESTAVVSAGPKGFSLKSADGKNQLKLRGTLHLDGRWISGTDPGGTFDTFTATRVRPIFEGTFASIYDFKFMPDFGQGKTVVQDAYVNARFNPGAQLELGKFKAPIGLERLQSANDMRWVQRGFPTSLVTNRDIGLMVQGDLGGGRFSYQAAYLNGSNDGGSSDTFGDVDINDDKEYALRLFTQPFAESDNFALRGLGFGVAGSWNDQVGSATQPLLPSFKTPGQSTFFKFRAAGTTAGTIADGKRFRLAPQFYYYVGALGVLGEYTEVEQDVSRAVPAGIREATVDTNAWQLAVSYFLTGEEASFKGFQPKTRFSPSEGTWGAFEIKARVQQLNVDDNAFSGGADSFADPLASASQADSYGIGLNWYLNENLKWLLDLEHTTFEGGAATGDRKDEDSFQLRLAIAF